MTPYTKLVLTFAIAAIPFGPAFAQEGPRQIRVRTSDVDLSSPKAAMILTRRVQRAAELLCNSGDERLDSGLRRAAKICRDEASAKALTAIKAKLPTALARR